MCFLVVVACSVIFINYVAFISVRRNYRSVRRNHTCSSFISHLGIFVQPIHSTYQKKGNPRSPTKSGNTSNLTRTSTVRRRKMSGDTTLSSVLRVLLGVLPDVSLSPASDILPDVAGLDADLIQQLLTSPQHRPSDDANDLDLLQQALPEANLQLDSPPWSRLNSPLQQLSVVSGHSLPDSVPASPGSPDLQPHPSVTSGPS